MKSIAFIGLAAALCGCATTQSAKPQLPQDHYRQYSETKLAALKCVANGHIAPEIGARAVQYADAGLNSHTYDAQYMQSVWSETDRSLNPTQSQCNILSMNVARKDGTVEGAEEQQQQAERNKPVRCSTTFGVTTCY